MVKIDALGIACPGPVIMTKKQLDGIEEGIVEVRVDNEVARQNLKRFAESSGFEVVDQQDDEALFTVTITKGTMDAAEEEQLPVAPGLTVGIGSNLMGTGEEELGKVLMRSFMYTVSETEPYPETIVFFNSGVFLTTEGSDVLDDLEKLAGEGVEIISCGTCLDYYKLKDKLAIGEISNMYTIYEKLKNPGRNVIIG
ncbi:MAG: sulfurtransferase-like selenium metabolism protein YedF [Tissierellia bacterium]|nr:sulfurtransferase-like selenium metabolism protein YedF [Tissierellia bacterium]